MTRHAKSAAAIYVVHALLPCTVTRAYCIPLFILYGTSYPFRSNVNEVAFIGLFRQKRLETASLEALRSVSFHVVLGVVWHVSEYATITASFQPQNVIDKRPGIGSALTVTCWLETLSQLKRAIMQMPLAVVQRPVPGDPAASAPAITMMRPRLGKPV